MKYTIEYNIILEKKIDTLSRLTWAIIDAFQYLGSVATIEIFKKKA